MNPVFANSAWRRITAISASAIGGSLLTLMLLQHMGGMPGPLGVASGALAYFRSGDLFHDVLVSTARWLSGWGIGLVLGIVLGVATGLFRTARIGLEGFLVVTRAVPYISLVPLSILLVGLDETGKIGIVAWATATTTWIILHQAALAIPDPLLARARCLGVSGTRWYLHLLPSLLGPSIFTAARTTLSLGLIVVAVAELAGVYERSSGHWWSEGLGYRLFRSLDDSNDERLLAVIILFAGLGVTADLLFRFICALAGVTLSTTKAYFIRSWIRSHPADHRRLDFGGEPIRLDIESLAAGYGTEPSVFADLTLRIDAGRTLALGGKSGCGKSTLVKAVFGSPWSIRRSGSISGSGEDGPESPRIGIVTQGGDVFDRLTVWENVAIAHSLATKDSASRRSMIVHLLRNFDLLDHATKQARDLSGGQTQRLALLAVLANDANVLLLDEPFASLDAITRRSLQQFFRAQISGRVTCILISHDPDELLTLGDDLRIGLGSDVSANPILREVEDPFAWQATKDFAEQRFELVDHLSKR